MLISLAEELKHRVLIHHGARHQTMPPFNVLVEHADGETAMGAQVKKLMDNAPLLIPLLLHKGTSTRDGQGSNG